MLCVAVLFAFQPRSAVAQTPPSAAQFYTAALEATKHLESPPIVTYTAKIQAKGAEVTVARDPHTHHVVFFESIGPHENPATSYIIGYRFDQDVSDISVGGKYLGQSPRAIFDPTWQGVYDWLTFGSNGEPARLLKKRALPLHPVASKTAAPLKTIAILSAMGSSIYAIRDGGAAICPNGDIGHQLITSARRNPSFHPLLGVIVDLKTGVFCSLRFRVTGSGPMVGITGYAEEHFASVGKYWLATDLSIEDDVRVAGIALHHVSVNVAYTDMAFPSHLPPVALPTPAHENR